ncbi:ATP-binding protein [Natronorubrum thiooxidans]|uniref:Signal transduction histidine kinase n=1 Tax=Natronorubrum thiooxidans TaxID=308853 RepID=A0A1N7EY35_9EURY|nr:HAMP domain-containing histidine kinase [Natronorubrum thiooxidans]SIR92964.1 Signal transduction histidine kinase [Natronorubrum thiooxidans]
MPGPSRPQPQPQQVLYLAGSDATAREGATALEAVPSDQDRAVYPLSTASAGTPGTWVTDVDCVVFAETPTTTAGASLLEVSEACESTPLVLFTDASYTPTAAHATDGVDGYVRQGTENAVAHLADEIEWVCRDAGDDTNATDASRPRTAFECLPEPALRYERVDGHAVVRAVTDDFVDTFDIDREAIIDSPLDVTEATRDTRALATTRTRLETIADVLDDDVATALNVASGYLEAAEEIGHPDHFAAVDEAQGHLRERIDELASIARRDESVGETEPVAIHDIARRAWAAIVTDDARLVTPDGTDRILEADKTRLQKLFEGVFRTLLEDEPAATSAVIVGATDDGFFVGNDTDGDSGLSRPPLSEPLAVTDEAGVERGSARRIADAHGWTVASTSDDEHTVFVCSGVDDAEIG